MTAPLFTIEGQDGASLAVYEATNGKAMVLQIEDSGQPAGSIKLGPVELHELGQWIRRQLVATTLGSGTTANPLSRIEASLHPGAVRDFEQTVERLRDKLAEKAGILGYPLSPHQLEMLMKGLYEDAARGPAIIALHPKEWAALKRDPETIDAYEAWQAREEQGPPICPPTNHGSWTDIT